MEGLGNLVYDQTVQQWLLFLVILIVAAVIGKIVYSFFKYIVRRGTVKTRTLYDDILVDVIEEPIVLLIFIAAFWYSLPMLELTADANNVIYSILKVIIVLTIGFTVVRFTDRAINKAVRKEGFQFDTRAKKLLPAMQKIVKIVVVIVMALVIFDIFNLKLTSLIAGLGLGGLAVALAAKDTLANFFGSVTVMTDQPFKEGDTIKIEGHEGVVKEIGLRSTRIKTKENTEVIVPNTKIANSIIENLSYKTTKTKSPNTNA